MQNNIFFGGSDPLLGTTTDYSGATRNIEDEMARLDRAQKALEQRKQEMAQARTRMASGQPQSQAPIWDEIEKLTADFSDREFAIVNQDDEFQQSQNNIMAIMQREYMRMMRPIVEGTKDGKEALENHLALIKQLKKKAAKEADRNMELFNEYTQNYSDMTFTEFMKMKNGTNGTNKKTKK